MTYDVSSLFEASATPITKVFWNEICFVVSKVQRHDTIKKKTYV